MKVLVIGKKHVKFTNSETNKEVEMFKIFATHKNPISDDITQYEGEGCSEISVPEYIYSDMIVGCDYIMEFDRKGKLLEVSECN